ncbi:MAG TPA: hypothetical protein VHA13_00305 [Gammaproteobacteria bacterium]|nr:hypothetical protein [Gammaproteobacteria bacterium]
MSSSAKILGFLSENSTESKNEEFIIQVPQKCYAYISPETDKSIKGLHASGINTCTGIVVLAHDITNKHIFLCHADSSTNLTDKEHGLPGWFKLIPNEVKKIEIQLDNVSPFEEGPPIYLDAIKSAVAEEKDRDITISKIDTSSQDLLIRRNGEIIRDGSSIDEVIKVSYFLSSDIERDIYPLNIIGGPMAPICVFNGRGLLNKADISKYQPNIGDALETAGYIDDQIKEFGENAVRDLWAKRGPS